MTGAEFLLLFTGNSAGAIAAIREVETSLNGMATKAEESQGKLAAALGKAAVVVGAAVATAAVVGAVAAVKMAGDFQSATQRLVSSAGETQANLGKVRDGLTGLMGQVGESADQMTQAYYVASSAGFNYANGGLKVVQAAAEGAKAENADLKVVTDAVTTALVDYHLKADQAALVTSKLIAGVSQGKTTFAELTGALHSVLPLASAMHVSLDDIVGSLASMTVHGMSADQATQNMSHTLQHLQTVTPPQAKELAALGISARDLSDSLSQKGLSGSLQMIDKAIQDHMGADQKHVILNLLDAVRKLPPEVQALAQQAVAGTISMKDYNHAARDLPPVLAGQASGFATLLKQQTGIGKDQQNGQQIMQSYAAALKAATGDSTTLRVALMLTGENTDRVNKAVKAVGAAHTEAGNHVLGWAGIQSTFNQKLSEAHGAFDAILIKVGTGFLPMLGKLSDWFTGHQQQIGDFVSGVLVFLGDILSTVGAILGVTVIPLLGQLADHMTAVKVIAIAVLGPWLAWKAAMQLKDAYDGVVKFGGAVKDMAETGYVKFLYLKDGADKVGSAILDGGKAAGSAAKDFVTWAASGVANAAKATSAWVAEKTTFLISQGQKAAVWTANMAQTGAQAVAGAAVSTGAWVAEKVAFLAGQAAKLVVWLATNAIFVATAVATGIAAAAAFLLPLAPFILIGVAVVALVALIVTHFTQIKDFISSVIGDVVGFVRDHWQLMLAILTGPIGLAIYWVTTHFGQIRDAIDGVWEDVKRGAAAAWDWIVSKVAAAIEDLKKKFTDLKSAAADAIGSLPGAGVRNAILGHIPGFATGSGWLTSPMLAMIGDNPRGERVQTRDQYEAEQAAKGDTNIVVNNPASTVDVTSAVQSALWLDQMGKRGVSPTNWPSTIAAPGMA